jgi:hypothetical protein
MRKSLVNRDKRCQRRLEFCVGMEAMVHGQNLPTPKFVCNRSMLSFSFVDRVPQPALPDRCLDWRTNDKLHSDADTSCFA